MELEEMKNLWQQHDNQLQQNRLLNESIIKRMLNDKSNSAISKMANWEYLNLGTCAIVLMVFGTQYWNLGDNNGLIACYIASIVLMSASLALGLYRMRYLSGINIATDAVTDARQKIEKFRLLITKEKSVVIISLPAILFPVYVVINYWVHHVNMLDHITPYVFRIVLALAVGIPASFLVYRKIYFNNIKQIKENLAEIEDFKKGN